MQLHISDTLRKKLVVLRSKQLQRPYPDEVLVGQDVVVLTLGFGPAIYLGLDGRVIIWHYMDDESPRITEDIRDIAAGLVIGAKNNKIPELLDLLPTRPANGIVCRLCTGRRWIQLGILQGFRRWIRLGILQGFRTRNWVVCWECSGLGWHDSCVSHGGPGS